MCCKAVVDWYWYFFIYYDYKLYTEEWRCYSWQYFNHIFGTITSQLLNFIRNVNLKLWGRSFFMSVMVKHITQWVGYSPFDRSFILEANYRCTQINRIKKIFRIWDSILSPSNKPVSSKLIRDVQQHGKAIRGKWREKWFKGEIGE